MAKARAFFTRAAIFIFAAVASFYSLYVSSMGRVHAQVTAPDEIGGVFSGMALSLGFSGIADMLRRLRWGDFTLAAFLFAAICFCGEICFQGQKRASLRRGMLKWLRLILPVLAVLWVALRLNNTSLFAWSDYLGGNEGTPLFGAARGIRLDEFGIWTPMALSQEYLGWPAVNSLIGKGTDVTWISMGGLPAWNAALIFKPLYWIFLLLGADYGLSFLCISRLLLLFMVSYRLALGYTKNNQSMSIAAAAIFTLSPMTQWFISQSIAEVLIFGQGMILAIRGLIHSRSSRQRAAYSLLNAWLLGCLVMVGYPAWIIPVIYLILAMSIYLFSRHGVQERGKKLKALFLALIPSLAALGVIVYQSWDTLQTISSSLYPGGRLITGGLKDSYSLTGGVWNSIFKFDLASIFCPLEMMEFNYSNAVDAAAFLGFAPAGLVLSIEHQCRERKVDPVSVIIISVMVLFWLFTFVQLPAWLCKVTLLSQCSRPAFVLGICEVVLLVRARAGGGIRDRRLAILAAMGSAALNLAGILYYKLVQPGMVQLVILSVLYLFVFCLLYLDFSRSGSRFPAFFLCCVLLLAGGFVNPVQQGLDMLDDYDLISALKAIPNEPDDLYMVEEPYPISNIPLLAGKRCISTDQPYADFDRWAAIDSEGRFQDVYNRLCHVSIDIAEPGQETEFREEGNYILIQLTWEDLETLGVNYLITPRDDLKDATLVASLEEDDLYIWKLR